MGRKESNQTKQFFFSYYRYESQMRQIHIENEQYNS